MADIKQYVKAAEEKMTFAIEYLDEQLSHIRAGKANPKILDCVRVMYYGAPVPLTNVATVTVPDARTIMITPWEKKIIKDIEKGIMDSEVGITPENNGEVIRLGIPPLTEERRRLLAKQSKQEAETAKISIRNARRDAIEQLKKSIKTDGTPEDVEKDAEAEVQKVHDKYAGEHSAEVTIVNRHTLISRIVKDGEVLYQIAAHEDSPEYVDKSVLNVKDILEFADTVRIEDVKDILDRQITMNSAISDEGLNHPYGAQVGRTLLNDYGNDVKIRARARAAAGSDARMSGCSLPVVINSGSGNQGMTVSLPVIEFAKEWNVSQDKLYRALVVSNLIAVHQKKYIGSLSAYCGAVSAGCGAGAAITYLSGGSYEDVSLTIVNTIGNVGGIVCDGAKSSCAAKIASAVDAAILAHYMGQHHRSFQPGEGIVREDVEDTIKSMGYIGRVGMKDTDTEILNIMIDRVDIDEVCK